MKKYIKLLIGKKISSYFVLFEYILEIAFTYNFCAPGQNTVMRSLRDTRQAQTAQV